MPLNSNWDGLTQPERDAWDAWAKFLLTPGEHVTGYKNFGLDRLPDVRTQQGWELFDQTSGFRILEGLAPAYVTPDFTDDTEPFLVELPVKIDPTTWQWIAHFKGAPTFEAIIVKFQASRTEGYFTKWRGTSFQTPSVVIDATDPLDVTVTMEWTQPEYPALDVSAKVSGQFACEYINIDETPVRNFIQFVTPGKVTTAGILTPNENVQTNGMGQLITAPMNTAFNVDFGTANGQVRHGDDAAYTNNRFPSNNSDLVHITGTESISGAKTFSAPVKITNTLGNGVSYPKGNHYLDNVLIGRANVTVSGTTATLNGNFNVNTFSRTSAGVYVVTLFSTAAAATDITATASANVAAAKLANVVITLVSSVVTLTVHIFDTTTQLHVDNPFSLHVFGVPT